MNRRSIRRCAISARCGRLVLLVLLLICIPLIPGCRLLESSQQREARRFFESRKGVADTWSRRHFAVGGTLRRCLGADSLRLSAAVLIAWECVEPRFAPGESRINQISDVVFGLAGWGLAPTPGQAVNVEALAGREVSENAPSRSATVSASP